MRICAKEGLHMLLLVPHPWLLLSPTQCVFQPQEEEGVLWRREECVCVCVWARVCMLHTCAHMLMQEAWHCRTQDPLVPLPIQRVLQVQEDVCVCVCV